MASIHGALLLAFSFCAFLLNRSFAAAACSTGVSSPRPLSNISSCPLKPGRENHQVANVSKPSWPYQIYKSSSFNPPELQITTNGKPLAPGLLLFTPSNISPIRAAKDVAPLIMTDAGELVWSGPTVNSTNLRVTSYKGKAILTYWSGLSTAGANIGHGYGNVTFLDSSYNTILTVCPQLGLVTPDNIKYPCEADLHESFVTDRNTILISAYNATRADLSSLGGPRDGWVFDCLFFEIDPEDGSALFKWSSLEHVSVSSSKQPVLDTGIDQSAPFDYFHINSVVNVGGAFLVNARHTWSTYLVSSTGDVVWTLEGETGGDFGPLPAAGHFRWQHNARPGQITNTSFTISYFNNYNQALDNGTHPSNGLEYQLTLPPSKFTSPKLTKRLEVASQPLYADSQGSTSILPYGNVFLDYGQIAVMREFGPSPNRTDLRWSARFAPDNLVQSYRGVKQVWHGYPSWAPSLVVERGSCGCYAGYVSWNGATGVHGWAVFAGEEASELEYVGTSLFPSTVFIMSESVGMSSCCLSGAVHDGTPSGRVDTIGGLQTYIAEPKTGEKTKSLIFICDIFGWEFSNTRLLADEYAKKGFYCYVPDFHEGDSLPIDFLQNVEPPLKKRETLSMADKAKNAAIVPATLGPWLVKHREAVSKPLIDGFVNTVRKTPGTNKVGAIGFCWGGRYAILQAHGQLKDGSGSDVGGVDAAYACHPSLVAIPADFDPVTKPLSLALGTKDSLLDVASIGKIQDTLAKKTDVPHEIQIYEDQIHGFALRSDWSSDKDKKAMDDAEKQGVEWFSKYLS